MSERKPIYQSRRLSAERRTTRLVSNPSTNYSTEIRPLAALRMDLPGTKSVKTDSRFATRIKSFAPEASGISKTPIERKKAKKPRS